VSEGAAEPTAAPSRTAGTQADETIGYPQGKWVERDQTGLMLSAAHILVTHEASQAAAWASGLRLSTRSQAEALDKALTLQRALAQRPAEFEAIAARESDHVASARLGGRLGMFAASGVAPEFVNALSYLKPGEISRVVETQLGYHVIERLAPPPVELVGIAHLVIKPAGAGGWLRTDRPQPVRDREQASALAEQLSARLKASPAEFAALVAQYSDANDVVRGGDLGVWSRREPFSDEPVLVEAAAQLQVGGLSEVIETNAGFHIVQRTSAAAREPLAVSVITLTYTESQVDRFYRIAKRSRAQAETVARELIGMLRKHPESFAQRRAEYCELGYCEDTLAFATGQGLPAMERALSALAPGEITTTPVDSPIGVLVLRREDARKFPVAPQPQRFDFDDPVLPVTSSQPEAGEAPPLTPASLARDMETLGQYARQHLKLRGATAARFAEVIAEHAKKLAGTSEEQLGSELQRGDQLIAAVLGAERHEQFTRYRRAQAAGKLGPE
jgi:parvulin-like peptidyl-prolyl isomerase